MTLNPEKLRIALIDDNVHMRDIISTILSSYGVREIMYFADGQSALEALPHAKVDVIFCDMLMEPLDGLTVVKMIRWHADKSFAKTPIIMLSGIRETRSVIRARDLGATEYLVKPVAPAVLWQRVKSLFRQNRPFVETDSYRGPLLRPPNEGSPVIDWAPLPIPEEMLASTPEARLNLGLKKIGSKYPQILAEDINYLFGALPRLKLDGFVGPELRSFYRRSHDIKGQAGTFDFDLVTEIAKSLCDLLKLLIDNSELPQNRHLTLHTIIRMHLDALKICSDLEIRGDGGADGKELLQTIKVASRKVIVKQKLQFAD